MLRAIWKKEIAHHPTTQGEGRCKGATEHSRIQHHAFARRSTAFLSSSHDTCTSGMLWTRRRLIQLAINCYGEEVQAAIVSEVLAAI